MTESAHRHFILATAGHVDHGKSALVRYLTGTDPDRLPEEKARGITIDLGFAKLKLKSPDATATYDIGVVDVPGHEDFVKNMVAGVGSIDAALLVVAADDGWMPQTEEHFQILLYLGVRTLVVALSKIDLTNNEAAAIASIRSRLAGTPMADAPIVPTSIPSGRGIDDLKNSLAATLSHLSPQRDIAKPRLPIDRVFTLKGIGTVVTGTLIGGSLERNQSVIAQPSGTASRVRSMQRHGREIAIAVAGSRVALNLPDVQHAIGRDIPSPGFIRRGDLVTIAAAGRPSRRICALITRSDRAAEKTKPAQPIKTGALVHLHHASAAVPARIRFLDGQALNSGDGTVAVVTTKTPLLFFAGDRFVLRDGSQQHTIAGGLVLDPLAPVMSKRNTSYKVAIQALSKHPADVSAHLSTCLIRDSVVQRDHILAPYDFHPVEIEEAVAAAISSGAAVAAGPFLIDPAFWNNLRQNVLNRVLQHHTAYPEQMGLPLVEAGAIISKMARRQSQSVVAALKQAIVEDFGHHGFICTSGVIRQLLHRPQLPVRLRQAGEVVRQILIGNLFTPPPRKTLCPTDASQQALRFLILTGAAIELAPDVILSTEAYACAVKQIRTFLGTRGTATVSELKMLLESNRRVIVPLLERLDQDAVTIREGDLRRLHGVQTIVRNDVATSAVGNLHASRVPNQR